MMIEATSLTRRERDVIALLSIGLSAKEIAECLLVSVHTVRKTIDNVKIKHGYGKLIDLAATFIFWRLGGDYGEFKQTVVASFAPDVAKRIDNVLKRIA
jgi:orotate phosphoribosyltransferase-like protein